MLSLCDFDGKGRRMREEKRHDAPHSSLPRRSWAIVGERGFVAVVGLDGPATVGAATVWPGTAGPANPWSFVGLVELVLVVLSFRVSGRR